MNTQLVSGNTAKFAGVVIDMLLYEDAWSAKKYVSEKLVISATRKRYGKSGWTKRDTRADITVKIGAPNYLERVFIKQCKRAGVPFPVKRVQLKQRPVRRG